jgi:hypothetical protein
MRGHLHDILPKEENGATHLPRNAQNVLGVLLPGLVSLARLNYLPVDDSGGNGVAQGEEKLWVCEVLVLETGDLALAPNLV